MHLAEMDHLANNGDSFFHKAGVPSKMGFTLIMLTAIIVSNNINVLGILISTIILMFLIGRIPLIRVGHLAIYPAFFSILFALIKLQESIAYGLVVILKAVGAALTMIFLISTTPYVDIFSHLSLVLPNIIVDIFFFTYRSVFILLDKAENLFRSIKLRGGYNPLTLFLNFRNISHMIGTLIIHSFEMGERMQKIYALRGYEGCINVEVKWFHFNSNDIIILGLGIVILVGTVMPWYPW